MCLSFPRAPAQEGGPLPSAYAGGKGHDLGLKSLRDRGGELIVWRCALYLVCSQKVFIFLAWLPVPALHTQEQKYTSSTSGTVWM